MNSRQILENYRLPENKEMMQSKCLSACMKDIQRKEEFYFENCVLLDSPGWFIEGYIVVIKDTIRFMYKKQNT